ncbi:hypothetical protein BH11PLA1_BH11PLA1_09020 [soil metagenome]
MASTTAMFTGLTGLIANARSLDVIGNNIANVNTTAFKSNRMLFASQFARNLSLGSQPGENTGGSNPAQIGLGVTIAGTQRNFSSGSLSTTGDARDLAIDGEGLFLVNRGTQRFYTRAGAFRQDAASNLVTVSGERLQGYGVDANFNIVSGTLTNLNIPVGQLRLAEATTEVRFTGNLNSGSSALVASRGSRTTFGALTDLTTAPATGATLLTSVDNAAVAGSQAQFVIGQQIQLNGVEKGGKELPTAALTITAATTVSDYLTFLNQALGLNATPGANPDGFTPGATIDAAGVITVVGNVGAVNDLKLDTTALRQLDAAGASVGTPFTPTKVVAADGESVRHTFVTYDSLGSEVRIDLDMVLVSRTGGNGTTWRYFVESGDAAGVDLRAGTGTVDFDAQGRAVNPTPLAVTIDRNGSGAENLGFDIVFSSPTATVSALADTTSTLAAVSQNGTPVGVLTGYSVGQNGLITGAFSNGQTRPVGQVVLAKFSNPEGLVDVGSNLFANGPNSGTPVVTVPTGSGAGRIVGGALEQSNVDLAQEFINMILASTGYSASSRVITTTDQLVQQLLTIGR